MNKGYIKRIGSETVDVQLSGSAAPLISVRVSGQIDLSTLRVGGAVLVDEVNGQYVVLHTLANDIRSPIAASSAIAVAVNNNLAADGSVPLTGNLYVTPGVTIDGYDISVLGQAISNLQAADTIARTGWTALSHSTHLVETISAEDTEILVRDAIFELNEQTAMSNTDGEVEFMRIDSEATSTVDNKGAVCYQYTVTRRVATSPSDLFTGWAAATLINGLTSRGYITVDNRHQNSINSPNITGVIWTDDPPTDQERIFRLGALRGILGIEDNDFGFAFGMLDTKTSYFLYNASQGSLNLSNVDYTVWGASEEMIQERIQGKTNPLKEQVPEGEEEEEQLEQIVRIYGQPISDRAMGDFDFGRLKGVHNSFYGDSATWGVYRDEDPIIEINSENSFIKSILTIGNTTGARINLGEENGRSLIAVRNKFGVVKAMFSTDDSGEVFAHIGNAPPEANSVSYDGATNTANVDAHLVVRSATVVGRLKFGETGEFKITDPDDPGHFGMVTPRGQYAYTKDSTGTTHLIRVDAWGPLVLEDVLGSNQWKTYVGGTQISGDPRYRHFRVERGVEARVGLFNGEVPVAYLDATGNGYFTGIISATGGNFIGSVYVGAANPRIHIDGTNKYIESTNFASGTSGFRIAGTSGNAEFNNVTVRGAIATSVLQYGYVQATSGSNWVTKASGVISGDFAAPEVDLSNTLVVSDPAGIEHAISGSLWATGDIVRIKEPLLGDWWGVVGTITDLTTSWQLSVKTTSITGDGLFTAGATILNYGQSGDGIVRVTADADYSPYISIATHAAEPWDTLTERARLGNLDGISGASGYGLWTDNGFFTGTVTANAGSIGGWTIASGHLYSGSGSSRTGMRPADYPFYAGNTDPDDAPFSVTKEGVLKAISGTIGGWSINSDSIVTNYYDTSCVILSANGYIHVGGAGSTDVVRLDASNTTHRLWVGHWDVDDAPFSVTKAGAIKAVSGTVGGWTLGAVSLTGGDATLHNTGYLLLGTGDDIARLDAADATYRLWIGDATAADAPFSVTKAGAVKATSGTIGGWILDTDLLKSAASGARLEMNKTKNRISMFDAVNEKVAMGYLNGLARNDGTGNWGAGDYGFWALAGDKLVIDGDGEYVSGDWIVMNDGAYLIQDADENTIVRLGTDTGDKGLFIYDTSGTQLARFVSDEIWIGETGSSFQYTAADGLEVEGSIIAGGGSVLLNSDGIAVEAYQTSLGSDSQNRYRFVDSSGDELSYLAGVYGSANALYMRVDSSSFSDNFIYIGTAASGNASTSIVAAYDTDSNKAQVQAASNSSYGVVNVLSEYLEIYNELGLTGAQMTVHGTATIDQSDSSGAVPVLVLDQADVSEEMIEFVSTAGAGNAIEAVGTKTLTVTHYIKVTVNGDTRYIPVGTIA